MGFNKNEVFETLTKIGFAVILLIVVMVITLGIDLDFKRLLSLDYWAQVIVQLIITMIVFNMVATSHLRTKSLNKNGRFFISYATNKLRIEEIENNDLYDKLSEAVEIENKDLYIKKCNDLIHKVSFRLNYNEVIENINNIDCLVEKYKITKKRRIKSLKKVAYKIYSGKVRIKKIKDYMFLRDKELNTTEESMISLNTSKDKLKGNIYKMTTFLIVSMFLQMLTTSFKMVNFWTWLITNLTLFISAIASGFYEANREIRLKTAMYEERNAFLKRKLNINVVYKGE